MSNLGTVTVSLRIPNELHTEIVQQAERAGMNKTEYILTHMQEQKVFVLEQGKDIARLFVQYLELLEKLNEEHISLCELDERGDEICALLSLLINELREVNHSIK